MIKYFFAASFICCIIFLALSAQASRLSSPAPSCLTHATIDEPLSLSPILTWTKDINAVSYEIEICADISYIFSDRKPCKKAFFRSKYAYYENFNPPIKNYLQLKNDDICPLVWRVRALNQKMKPISPFSQPAVIFVSSLVPELSAPVPLHPGSPDDEVQLLFPVYSWISPHGSDSFEVEVYDQKPGKAITPVWTGKSSYSELYDEYPRVSDKPFFWRVRAYSADKKPVGGWSEFLSFTFSRQTAEIAIFGDSISHGGGNISFGPNHRELSWPAQLDFPVLNLSESGNLTINMIERFDRDVLPFSPKYLLIMGGTNDFRNDEIPASETIKNLAILKEKCLKNNIRPIFLTLPPINPKNIKRTFNESTDKKWKNKRKTCNEFIRNMPYYIDTAAYFEPFCKKGILPTEYALDGLHPGPNGKKLIAKSVNDNWKHVTE